MKLSRFICAPALGPAVTFGLIQSVTVYFWVHAAKGTGWEHMIWMVGGLTFVLGLFFWKRFARKPGGMNARQGAAAGFITGLLVSPVFWLLLAPPLVMLNSWKHMSMAEWPTIMGGLASMSLLTLLIAGLPPLFLCTLAGGVWAWAGARRQGLVRHSKLLDEMAEDAPPARRPS